MRLPPGELERAGEQHDQTGRHRHSTRQRREAHRHCHDGGAQRIDCSAEQRPDEDVAGCDEGNQQRAGNSSAPPTDCR